MPRPAPDIEHIYREANKLLQQQGEAGLSIRHLAAKVGCSPMSLYAHIGKREDLIDGIVLRFFQSVDIDIPEQGNWQQKVLHWARKVRAAFLANPGVVPLIKPKARWTLETTISKQLYQILFAAGFEKFEATSLCRTLMWQVTATVMLEVVSLEYVDGKPGRKSSSEKFHQRLAKSHTLEMTEGIFDYTISLMLEGLAKEKRVGSVSVLMGS